MKKTFILLCIAILSPFCFISCSSDNISTSATHPNASQDTFSLSSANESYIVKNNINGGSSEDWYNTFKKISDLEKAGYKNQIVAKVNDDSVSEYDVQAYIINHESLGGTITEKQAFKMVASEKTYIQKADEMFDVSDSEIEEAAKQNYTMMKQDDMKDYFEAYCKGCGIEEDEYIDYIKPAMQGQILMQKLNSYLQEEYNKTDKNKEFKEYLSDYQDELYKNATIQILKDSLK